jgi:hypothetical protein
MRITRSVKVNVEGTIGWTIADELSPEPPFQRAPHPGSLDAKTYLQAYCVLRILFP